MSQLVDRTNKVYGDLTVLEICKERSKKRVVWKCRCKCGNIVLARSLDLHMGKTVSCGCRRRGSNNYLWSGCGEIPGGFMYSIIKAAKTRGIEVDINVKDIYDLYIQQNKKCNLTGVELNFGYNKNTNASLDRIDSEKGYTKDNIQLVHKKINMMKHILPQEEFVSWCKLVVDHNNRC
jgi:hypothetical protein